MSRIDKEKELLLAFAKEGVLPVYEDSAPEKHGEAYLTRYSSGETAELEKSLKALWSDESGAQKCIPVILAAVEKSRAQTARAIEHTELYNYTM